MSSSMNCLIAYSLFADEYLNRGQKPPSFKNFLEAAKPAPILTEEKDRAVTQVKEGTVGMSNHCKLGFWSPKTEENTAQNTLVLDGSRP